MKIIPAIDLKGGKVVRLYKGEFAKVKTYSDDPLDTACLWRRKGAACLHLVDLDGAAMGEMRNFPQIKSILESFGKEMDIEVGGGIRNPYTVSKILSAGASRVILGTIAFKKDDILKKLLRIYGEKISVSLDIKKGKVGIEGWKKTVKLDPFETLSYLENLGLKYIFVTDVSRDGTLDTPDYSLVRKIMRKVKRSSIIMGGGISNVSDISSLKKLGVGGVVIGRALYEGTIDSDVIFQKNFPEKA